MHPEHRRSLIIAAVGTAFLIASAVGPSGSPTVTAAVYLTLLVLGAAGCFRASFDTGMSLADTENISGGDHSPWAVPLHLVSLAAPAALAWLIVRGVLARIGTMPHAPAIAR